MLPEQHALQASHRRKSSCKLKLAVIGYSPRRCCRQELCSSVPASQTSCWDAGFGQPSLNRRARRQIANRTFQDAQGTSHTQVLPTVPL